MHMKRSLTSLEIRKMQNKNTKRYHYIPTRMDKIKKTDNTHCGQRCGKSVTLMYC